jgi:hypothetical protein
MVLRQIGLMNKKSSKLTIQDQAAEFKSSVLRQIGLMNKKSSKLTIQDQAAEFKSSVAFLS